MLPRLFDLINDYRQTAPTGLVRRDIERHIRSALAAVENPRASLPLYLLDTGAGRAFCVHGAAHAMALSLEIQPLHARIRGRFRHAIRADIKAFKDRAFREGLGYSALSGVELASDHTTHVDHNPTKFRDIISNFENDFEVRDWAEWDNPYADLTPWVTYHRDCVGWRDDGFATGLRLVTAAENIALESPHTITGQRSAA